jgi:hypothetical protein
MNEDDRIVRNAFTALKQHSDPAPDFNRTIRGRARTKSRFGSIVFAVSMVALTSSVLGIIFVGRNSDRRRREHESVDRALIAIAQSKLEPLGFLTTVPSIPFEEGPSR